MGSRCIYDVDWSKTGDNLIATASGDDAIRLFGETSESGFSLKCTKENSHDQDVNGVAWNPVKAGLLASVSDDGTAKIWNVLMKKTTSTSFMISMSDMMCFLAEKCVI